MGTATKTISYRYDANRNRTLMIDPEGGRTTYSYDVLNRVTQIINPQGERTTFAYDAKGRKTVKKLANGTRASFTYDAANRLTTLANLKSDNSVISQFDNKYDNVGNRTEVTEADGSRVTWSYDNTYQLTGQHRTGTTPYRNTFTYDSVGNRLVKNENTARTTYVYDSANQLKTSVDPQGTTTYTFDNDGNQNLVQAPTGARTTTTWDYENKTTLVQLPSGIRNTMAYEPEGLRIKLEESAGTKKFVWDDRNYLAESDENNDINVLYNNEPNYYGNLISQHRKSGAVWAPSFYHYEALGSTRQLTDDTEAVTDQYLYDAWGNVISSSGTTANPFQFTGNVGYYFDADTENQYIRARIYSPTIGRWLSVDPFFRPHRNLWGFSDSNPASNIDPSGRVPLCMAEYCSEKGPLNNFEGYYGIRAELIAESGQCCDGAILRFHWKESHAVPKWAEDKAKQQAEASGVPFVGCGELAHGEFSRGMFFPFIFGNILDRGCSRPKQKLRKAGPNKCHVAEVEWECKVECLGECTCSGSCGPNSSSLGIYPKEWKRDPYAQMFGIRIDTEISYSDEFCVLDNCSMSTEFGWLGHRNPLPGGPHPKPFSFGGECEQRDVDFLWNI